MEITLNSTEIILLITIVILLIVIISGSKIELKYNSEEVNKDKLNLLSTTEYKILEMLSSGKSNQTIANEMFISIATVKKHVTSIYKKLCISKRSETRSYNKYFSDKNLENS